MNRSQIEPEINPARKAVIQHLGSQYGLNARQRRGVPLAANPTKPNRSVRSAAHCHIALAFRLVPWLNSRDEKAASDSGARFRLCDPRDCGKAKKFKGTQPDTCGCILWKASPAGDALLEGQVGSTDAAAFLHPRRRLDGWKSYAQTTDRNAAGLAKGKDLGRLDRVSLDQGCRRCRHRAAGQSPVA